MKAFLYKKTGGPEKDEIVEVPLLTAKDLKAGQILVKVHAASLNPVDFKLRKGGAMDAFLKIRMPSVHGHDFAGTVEAKADDVARFEVGDKIFALVPAGQKGTIQEFLIIDSEVCVKMPESLSYEEAASLPLTAITVITSFRKCGLKENGEAKPRILILGGTGGVGTIAIQMAKNLYNASFVAVVASDEALCKDLGADLVINHRTDATLSGLEGIDKFDVLFDTVGTIKSAIKFVKDNGKTVSIGASPTGEGLAEWILFVDDKIVKFGRKSFLTSSFGIGIINRMLGAKSLRKELGKRGITYEFILTPGNQEMMEIIKKVVEDGGLKPVIDSEFPLGEAKKAMEKLEDGHAKGKIVINVSKE